METFLTAICLFLCIGNWSSAEHVVYTGGEGPCGSPPCLTLQDYLNNGSHFFTNHSSFLFLPGTHYLNKSLSLKQLENVTLRGAATGLARLVISPDTILYVCKSNSIAMENLSIYYQGYLTFTESYSVTLVRMNISSSLPLLYTKGLIVDSKLVLYMSTVTGSHLSLVHAAIQCTQSSLELSFSIVRLANEEALSADMCNVTFAGNTLFERNRRAVSLTGHSVLSVTGKVTFQNNARHDGAAVLLLHNSTLNLQAPVSMLFNNNSVEKFGGAIYVWDSDLTYFGLCHHDAQYVSQPCFFEIETNSSSYHDVSLVFQENSAREGSALHGGALHLCQVRINGNIEDTTGYEIFTEISSLSISDTISSDPLKVCSCTYGLPDCYLPEIIKGDLIPGKKFNLSIAAMGQVNFTAADIGVSVDTRGITVILLSNAIEAGCSPVTFQVFSSLSAEDLDSVFPRMKVYPHGCTMGYTRVEVQVQACPYGFTLITNTCVCEKPLNKLKNIVCNVQSGLIENGGDSWIKPHYANNSYRGFLWYGNCPIGYCNKSISQQALLDFSTPNTSNYQCANHREGILCGACEEGYSLTLNSLACEKCDNKFLSLLVLFGLAGIGLIVLLLLLHMTVASGTLSGLIFFANLFSVHRDIFFPFQTSRYEVSLFSVFLSWLNLDLGVPTCFYDGLDAYQYFWLQYAFPVYLLFLTVVIILSSKYSSRVGRVLGSNPIAVLATVILLSFNKILEVAVSTLTSATLEYSIDHAQEVVWTYDGNISYFKSWAHILLGTASIFVIIFLLLPYVLLLTFGYQLQAYSNHKGFHWFNKFTPLLDAYYAPYNRNARYWPGLLLILRIVLFISYLISYDNLIIIVSVVSATTIVSQLKVYNKTALNFLEASFNFNLCVLCTGTYHVKVYGGKQFTLTYICTGFVFLEFVGILIFHLWCRLSSVLPKHLCQLFSWNRQCLTRWKEIQPMLTDEDPDNYREPLLDSGRGINPRYS